MARIIHYSILVDVINIHVFQRELKAKVIFITVKKL